MEFNINNGTDPGRIQFTGEELESLRSAMEKLAKEKWDCIIANHPPEYWENYWNAVKRRRARI
jgi:hypothetical protein